jgi:hypothetical protein
MNGMLCDLRFVLAQDADFNTEALKTEFDMVGVCNLGSNPITDVSIGASHLAWVGDPRYNSSFKIPVIKGGTCLCWRRSRYRIWYGSWVVERVGNAGARHVAR